MYVVESKGGAIACMLLALFFLGTWPAILTLLERRGRLPQHTYLDYTITNLLAAVIIAFTFGEIRKGTPEAPNFLEQLSQVSLLFHFKFFINCLFLLSTEAFVLLVSFVRDGSCLVEAVFRVLMRQLDVKLQVCYFLWKSLSQDDHFSVTGGTLEDSCSLITLLIFLHYRV